MLERDIIILVQQRGACTVDSPQPSVVDSELAMKLENLVYRLVAWVCDFLERKHHYKIPLETRKELEREARVKLDALMQEGKDA